MPAPVHDKDGSDFGAKGILYLVAISGCLLSGFALLFSLQDFGAWSIQAMAYLTLFVLYCIRLFRAEKTRRARGRRRAMAVSGIVAIALTFAASGPAGLVFRWAGSGASGARGASCLGVAKGERCRRRAARPRRMP